MTEMPLENLRKSRSFRRRSSQVNARSTSASLDLEVSMLEFRTFEQRLSPFQYMDNKCRLILVVDDTEPILTFKDGMYCHWPKNKRTGKFDKSGLPRYYHVLQKKITWKHSQSFASTAR
jgi:hypothetical protein